MEYAETSKPTETLLITDKSDKYFSKVKFQGYSYLGADFTAVAGGPSLDFSFGARTSKYLYIGAGFGWPSPVIRTKKE